MTSLPLTPSSLVVGRGPLQEEMSHPQSLGSSIPWGMMHFRCSHLFFSSVLFRLSELSVWGRLLLAVTFPGGGSVFGLWLLSVDSDLSPAPQLGAHRWHRWPGGGFRTLVSSRGCSKAEISQIIGCCCSCCASALPCTVPVPGGCGRVGQEEQSWRGTRLGECYFGWFLSAPVDVEDAQSILLKRGLLCSFIQRESHFQALGLLKVTNHLGGAGGGFASGVTPCLSCSAPMAVPVLGVPRCALSPCHLC